MINARLAACATALCLAATGTPAAAASRCKLVEVAEWPVLSKSGSPIVEGSVNGRRVTIVLDSGGLTMVLRSAADRLGLTRRVAAQYRLFGVGGESYVESTIVDEFKIGSLVRKNWEVMVAGDSPASNAVDVMLGDDVLDKVDVEFDLPHDRVRLFQPSDCEGVALAYWASQGAGQVDLGPGPRITVPVQVNGQPLQALLDSGAATSVLDKAAAARLGIRPDSPGVAFSGKGGGLGPKAVDYWVAPLRSFAIGNEAISDTVIRFADLWKDATYASRNGSRVPEWLADTSAMLLGADFLRAHRVLVAQSQRKMYFTYEGGPVFVPKTSDGAPSRAPR